MRLAETATVFNFERLNFPYVGVTDPNPHYSSPTHTNPTQSNPTRLAGRLRALLRLQRQENAGDDDHER